MRAAAPVMGEKRGQVGLAGLEVREVDRPEDGVSLDHVVEAVDELDEVGVATDTLIQGLFCARGRFGAHAEWW